MVHIWRCRCSGYLIPSVSLEIMTSLVCSFCFKIRNYTIWLPVENSFSLFNYTEKRMLCYSIQQHWYQVLNSVQDNVATPVTAIMMVTVCISTDALSSVFISPDVSDTNSFHQRCWSIMPVLTDCNSLFPTYTCIILLHQTDTALTTQQTVPVWYRQASVLNSL